MGVFKASGLRVAPIPPFPFSDFVCAEGVLSAIAALNKAGEFSPGDSIAIAKALEVKLAAKDVGGN